MSKEKDIFSTLTPTEDKVVLGSDKKRVRPSDPEWTQYILDQLTKDEKYEEYPKLEGLKRLLIKEIGPIVKSKSNLVCQPVLDNNYTYIVTHEVHVIEESGEVVEYQGIAEANACYLPSPYDRYPASIASTRAYGRAVRDALKLQNVNTAEEMKNGDENETATKTQVNGIYNLCKKFGVDVIKVINHLNYGGKVLFDSPEKIDKDTARECLALLNQLGNNAKKAEDYK